MSYTQSTHPYPPTGNNRPTPDRFDEIREAEQKLLGEILWNPELMNKVKSKLDPEDFQTEKQKIIYRAMLNLHERDIPINELHLWERLGETGELDKIGGAPYLTYLPLVILNEQVKKNEEETSQILYWFQHKEHG